MNAVVGSGRFARMQQLFNAAVELPPERQAAFVRDGCSSDIALRDELLRLLEEDREDGGRLSEAQLSAFADTLQVTVATAIAAGQRVGAYEITGLLGDGGMGRVFGGRREIDGVEQQVAIKLIRAELLNPNLLSRFSGERQVLAGLNHPGICRLLDSGSLEDGTPYVVMERIDGRPLFDYSNEHRLSVGERVVLLQKICAAVEHAHRNLVVHRDIKSSNVLVDAAGEPKLVDFGIAKRLGAGATDTLTAERFFTPANAAPEQLRGESIGVGCDVYAIGALAYELMCGRPPFALDGLRAAEIEQQLLHVAAPSMVSRLDDDAIAHARGLSGARALHRQLRGDLDAIVLTCLRKSPSERYANVEQLSTELANWLANRPVQARGGNAWYRARKFIARHRLAMALSSALGMSVLIGTGALWVQSQALDRERVLAVLERDRAQQVVQLLVDSFSAADPTHVAGADLKVRDVLASARPRLDALAATQPALFATLAATVAEVELNVGHDGEAAALARRALQTVSVDPTMARRLRLLAARALTGEGNFSAAEGLLNEVSAADRKPALDWAIARGRLLNHTGHFAEAVTVLNEAVQRTSQRSPEDELATHARWNLASAYLGAGRAGHALAILDEMLIWQRRSLAPYHPRITLTRLRRLEVLSESARHAQAIEDARDIVRDVREVFGTESPMTALAIGELGLALYRKPDVPAAVTEFESALALWRRVLGADHPHTIRSAFNLAQSLAYVRASNARVEASFVEALTAAESRFGRDNNTTVFMRLGYADYLASRQRWAQALAALAGSQAPASLDSVDGENRQRYQALLERVLRTHCTDKQSLERCRGGQERLRLLASLTNP